MCQLSLAFLLGVATASVAAATAPAATATPADVDLLTKYTITTTVTKGVDEDSLPQLADVLSDLGIASMEAAFHKGQVLDTRTFLRLKMMDLRMLGLDREQIKAALAKIEELTVVTQETRTEPHPLLAERNTLDYGRLFVKRSVSSFEFFTAHFGAPVPLRAAEIVYAVPPNGCGYTEGAAPDYKGKFVVVDRGECKFIDKAKSVALSGAAAMLVVNSDETIFRMAASHGGPDAPEPDQAGTEDMAVVMLRDSARFSLASALERGPLIGRLTPLRCGSGPRCMPLLPEEEELAQQAEAGTISIVGHNGASYEFLAGTFGGVLPQGPVRVAVAAPLDACQELSNDAAETAGAAVVVFRGGCSFGDKALAAQAAGAVAVIVADDQLHALHNIGAAFAQARLIHAPGVFVTRRTGESLVEARRANSSLAVSFNIDNSIKAPWEALSHLSWPEDVVEQQVLLKQLQAQTKGTGERTQWVEDKLALLQQQQSSPPQSSDPAKDEL
eukprot:TRINITY_DN1071_c0_g1_i3.p1 TRINITY_DN1071_c0_g1~~TRINITY_DN1071_c0_g1_i3.p1  ORF type:complete len:500 (-),score=168.22 TRINITY_DN1071_c0_g1_i3:22-1521(-)